jgi:AsmA protein
MTGERTEFKDFNLAIKDLLIAGNIIRNSSFSGDFDCKEVQQQAFKIENLKATVKAEKGTYRFEPLTIGALAYIDKKTGESTEVKEIRLAINDLSTAEASGTTVQRIAFTGDLQCKEVRKGNVVLGNVKSRVKAAQGVISLAPFVMDIFGSTGEGSASIDRSKSDPVYKIDMKVAKLDFEKLEGAFGAKRVIGGKGDLTASLTMKGQGRHRLLSSMDGTFALRGDNLVLYSMDLDKVLTSYETSQEFDLVDLGAFFIAGPLSNLALKGYRYGDVYSQTRGGQGTITRFVSHWKIRNGVADATDCALATQHHRIALKGRLDLVNKRYEDVVVALLDDKGCAKFKQSISGPFSSPHIGNVSTFETLAGPIYNLYRKAKRFVEGDRCEVFYRGAVQQAPQ